MREKRMVLVASGFLLAAIFLAGFRAGQQDERRHFAFGLPDAAFSSAVQLGDTLYLAGHGGLNPGTNEVPDDPSEEARLALEAFQSTLQRAGMTMDDLVYVQVFCPDLTLYDRFNAVYRQFFKKELPSRAFIGSGALLFGMRFEIQGIAVKRR